MMMEGIKGMTAVSGAGGGRIGEVEDMGDGMQCSDHPYRTNPGGICAFCLQEKLGKLVSSSFPLPIRASSSSSSPSFRSDTATSTSTATATVAAAAAAAASSLSSAIHPTSAAKPNGNGNNDCRYHEYYTRRARIPFLLAKKKKKVLLNSSSASASTAEIAFKRSKSTTTPRRGRHFFVDADHEDDDIIIEDFSPRKRNRFWSFLYLSSKSGSSTKKVDKSFKENHCSRSVTTFNGATSSTTTAGSAVVKHIPSGKNCADEVIVEEDDSPTSQATASASSFERKVSRSRSVGCGSRSFSGDFFERISTGFGDCTLRRVESQREGKPKVANGGSALTRDPTHHHCMKERVKCGGIFGGFMMSSSSSSSSNSNSSCMVSTSGDDNANGKQSSMSLAHGRTRSWGWAFASPMRAFSKHSSKRDITRQGSQKNTTPNLDAVPSLLAVRI